MIPFNLKRNRSVFVVSLVLIFVATSLVFLSATMITQSETDKLNRLEVDISEKSLVESEQFLINYKINRLTSDIRFISDTLYQNFPDDGDYHKIEALWQSYSTFRGIYDQIRFLDTNGNEVVRIDYEPEGSVILTQDQMQNKKDRYYFQRTIDFKKNQIYISPLDLNVENGAIELPIKPVVRFAMPFFDQSGVKRGIVVLNYAASDVLAQIKSLSGGSFGNVFLLNKDGYWLYNSKDPYREWAFSYDANSTVKFPNYFPDEWNEISKGGSGALTTENGHFCFATITISNQHEPSTSDISLESDAGSWYVISYIPSTAISGIYPSSNLLDLAKAAFQKYALFYILLFVFSVVLAAYVAISKTRSNEVKYFSEFDTMTGAYNRRSGIEKLSGIYKNIVKTGCLASICFIDVNGLKQVNDTLGHEAGDELLITVSSAIRAQIRSEDFLVRLGGDEFLIVYSGIDEEQAEQAWQRIVTVLESVNQSEKRKYRISVSHGIETLSCSVNNLLDNVLHLADVKMYEEKQKIKVDLQIIRED